MVRKMEVFIGSTNAGKVAACRRAFSRAFGQVEVHGIPFPSGVAPSPQGEECFTGAMNRASGVRDVAGARSLPGDYFVGIEGGMVFQHDRWFGLSVTCIIHRSGTISYGTSPMYELPPALARRVLQGTELGDIIYEATKDAIFAQTRGAVGMLTQGLLTRTRAQEYGVLAALAPHLSAGWYEP